VVAGSQYFGSFLKDTFFFTLPGFYSHHFLFLASTELRPSLVLFLACKCLLYFLVVSLCHTEGSRSNTHSSPQPSTVMLCQPVLGSFRSIAPGLVMPGKPLCTSHSAPLAPPTLLLKTSTTLICIYTLSSRWITALSYKVFPFRPAHVWTQSAAQHFHHLHANASWGSKSSHFEWIMLPLHVSCYLRMSRVTSEQIT